MRSRKKFFGVLVWKMKTIFQTYILRCICMRFYLKLIITFIVLTIYCACI